METGRALFLTVLVPFLENKAVILYRDTVNFHIPVERRNPNIEQMITQTLVAPRFICVGTTNPGYICFVNDSFASKNTGSPFVVFVEPNSLPHPTIVSFGYRRDFKDMEKQMILWSNKV